MEHSLTDNKIPKDCIFIIDDFISEEDCDEIIKKIDLNAKTEHVTVNQRTNVKAKVVGSDIDLELSNKYMVERIRALCDDLYSKHKLPLKSFYTVEFKRIYGPTRLHMDYTYHESPPDLRCLSAIVALNSNYEGGELIFPVQNRTIKLKKGQLIAFPPYWTHPHYTNDLKNNTFRYTATIWFAQ
jgi:hypothetical protein